MKCAWQCLPVVGHRNLGPMMRDRPTHAGPPLRHLLLGTVPLLSRSAFHLSEENVLEARKDTAALSGWASGQPTLLPTATSCSGEAPSALISEFGVNGNPHSPLPVPTWPLISPAVSQVLSSCSQLPLSGKHCVNPRVRQKSRLRKGEAVSPHSSPKVGELRDPKASRGIWEIYTRSVLSAFDPLIISLNSLWEYFKFTLKIISSNSIFPVCLVTYLLHKEKFEEIGEVEW